MAKVSFWKALGMIGLVADELTKAGADNKITVDEALVIAKNLAVASGVAFDDAGSKLVVLLVTDFINAAADGKVTIKEMIDMTEKVCIAAGIEFDKTGIEV